MHANDGRCKATRCSAQTFDLYDEVVRENGVPGRENPSRQRRLVQPSPAFLDPVGEACAHVQGESLKAWAVICLVASQLPDAGWGAADDPAVSTSVHQ